MKTFTHPLTGVWNVALTIGKIAEIESITGINLGLPDSGSPSVFQRLCADAGLVARVLWITCQASAKAHGIPEEQFHEDIAVGKTFEAAHRALLEEWRDFFLARSIGGTGQRIQTAVNQFLTLIDGGNSSKNTPDTSASSPPS